MGTNLINTFVICMNSGLHEDEVSVFSPSLSGVHTAFFGGRAYVEPSFERDSACSAAGEITRGSDSSHPEGRFRTGR